MEVSYEERLAIDFGLRRRCNEGNDVAVSAMAVPIKLQIAAAANAVDDCVFNACCSRRRPIRLQVPAEFAVANDPWRSAGHLAAGEMPWMVLACQRQSKIEAGLRHDFTSDSPWAAYRRGKSE